jgi:hypothetical protein
MFAHSWDEIDNTTHTKKAKGPNRAPNTKILLTWHELSPCQVSYPCVQPKTCVMLGVRAWVFLLFSFLEHFLQGLVVHGKERIDVSKREQTLMRTHWGICALSRKNVIGTSKHWKGALDWGAQTPNASRRSLHPRFTTMPHFSQFF